MGPLTVSRLNPRYFADPTGRPVYLTGSHTWACIQERRLEKTPPFDYAAFLDFLTEHNHNFLRLWAWEHATWMQFIDRKVTYEPPIYARTGPGTALDGGPKFDLTRFTEEYFERLRSRVARARERGIYASVMLFQGFSVQQKGTKELDPGKGDAWRGHPFNAANNVNGIDGDADGDGRGKDVHTLAVSEVTRLQETYVRKVVDTVGDLDNVMYEIANESDASSTEWQYHMIEFVKEYEAARPASHPVGMTFQYAGGTNADLFASPADWISPSAEGGYADDPPASDGRKVVIPDTDHIAALAPPDKLGPDWVWKSFFRGLNPIFMDPYTDIRRDRREILAAGGPSDPQWDPIRGAMGASRRVAESIDLGTMTPEGSLSSTGYCLASLGADRPGYLVYAPAGGTLEVDLGAAAGELSLEWIDPETGTAKEAAGGESRVSGGARREFVVPFEGPAILDIR